MEGLNFRVSREVEAVKESEGGKFIGTSGVYDVLVKYVALDKSDDGFFSVNVTIEYEGNTQTIYNLGLQNKDGSPNFGANIFNSLCVIAETPEGNLATEVQERLVGRENKPMDLLVYSDLQDIPVKIWVQKEYSKYQGKIKERLNIKGFFRAEDGASATEILSNTAIGERLAKVLEKFASEVIYKDGLTKDIIDEYIEDKKKNRGSTASGTSQPKKNAFAQPAASFPKA